MSNQITHLTKIWYRNFKRNYLYGVINISGIALAIACIILIFLYVRHEFSYDHFYLENEQVYGLYYKMYNEPGAQNEKETFFESSDNGVSKLSLLPYVAANEVKLQIPEIKNAVRIKEQQAVAKIGSEIFESKVLHVDSSFFEVFHMPFKYGSNGLTRDEILITEKAAKKFFGDRNAIGQVISINTDGEERLYTVRSVLGPMPENSTFQFEILIRVENAVDYRSQSNYWFTFNAHLFVELTENADVEIASNKINDLFSSNLERIIERRKDRLGLSDNNPGIEVSLTAFKDIHLQNSVDWPNTGNPIYIYSLIAIGFLIMLIAVFNYTALSSSVNAGRYKEIGVRKTFGSTKAHIFKQYWYENQLSIFLSIILGLLLAELIIGVFNNVSGENISLDYFSDYKLYIFLLTINIVLSLLVAVYPSYLASITNVSSLFKQKVGRNSKLPLFKITLIFQYTISVGLIISTLIMFSQLKFIMSKDLGFNTREIIVLPLPSDEVQTSRASILKNKLHSLTMVENATISSSVPTQASSITSFEHEGSIFNAYIFSADTNFIDVLELRLKDGKSFREASQNEKANGIIVNESFMKELNLDFPSRKTINWNGTGKGEIIGVVKDFNFRSLKNRVEPLIINFDENLKTGFLALKLQNSIDSEKRSVLEAEWKDVFPTVPFNLWSLDQSIKDQYDAENNWFTILKYSSSIAIFLAAIGIVGFSSLQLKNKSKEISIRKILGADLMSLLTHLYKSIFGYTMIGIMIAAPIAWYVMDIWMDQFSYKADIGILSFIWALMISIGCTLLTISYHFYKVANKNPLNSIQGER